MKNQNIVFIAIAFALAFALAPVTKAEPSPQGGPDPVDLPVVTIHSTDNVTRGKIGAFVLSANPQSQTFASPRILLATTFVNFSVSGTAIPGVITLR